MGYAVTYCRMMLLLGMLIIMPARSSADDKDVLERVIHIAGGKGTVYFMLGAVSEQSGYLFIYDSKVVDNNRIVRLKSGSRTVCRAVHEIIGNDTAELRVLGKHILIYLPESRPVVSGKPDTLSYFTLEGTLLDKQSGDPVVYGTIGVEGSSVGSITNSNGEFRLRLPDSLKQGRIHISHLGYAAQDLDISILAGRHTILPMEPRIMEMPEVIVRSVDPVRILKEMLNRRGENCSGNAAYLTTFYREGIKYKQKFRSLTEAVFKIYKAPQDNYFFADQVKLIRKSSIINKDEKDTLIARISSGIDACLRLDLIKQLPDYLTPGSNDNVYDYTSGRVTMIDNKLVNTVRFEQKKGIKSPFYRGELYIDDLNGALLQANIEIHPDFVDKASDMLVVRKARSYKITPQKVAYTISYKPYNGKYYINHIRGDLFFKVKKKHQWFGNSVLHTWFEMVTCRIDTGSVVRFSRSERIPTRNVFSEDGFKYDEDFWGEFNVIPWEQQLRDIIDEISARVEKFIGQ